MEIKTFYSKTTGGFYRTDVNFNIPEDAVEITEEQYQRLLDGQSSGKQIHPDQNGAPVLRDPPPLTREQRVAIINSTVQAKLDAVAQEHGFDDIKEAVSYADEPAVPLYQKQGQAFRTWRSIVWKFVEDTINPIQEAKKLPKPDILISQLPKITVPTEV